MAGLISWFRQLIDEPHDVSLDTLAPPARKTVASVEPRTRPLTPAASIVPASANAS